jgi:mannose-6-phosphate isomerase-like protein (cupin superfamily)
MWRVLFTAAAIAFTAGPAAAAEATFHPGRFAAPPTAPDIGRAWLADGYSCVTTNLTAGYDVTHTNIIAERIAVVRGGLDVTVGGETYELSPGDAIHLPVGTKRRQTTAKRPVSVIAFGYGPYGTPKNRCG